MTDPHTPTPPHTPPSAQGAPLPPPAAPVAPPVPPVAPPTGAYGVPIGGYPQPAGGYMVPVVEPPASRAAGAIALIAAVIAAVVAPLVGAIFAYQIGALLPTASIDIDTTVAEDLAMLSPARMQVLWAEVSFWAGTALGIFALIVGIIATVKRRGRGMGIAAIIIAAAGPVLFFVAVSMMLGIGAAVGSL